MERGTPTVRECWRRLQKIDEGLEAATDNARWRRLTENRAWWLEQLGKAQHREDCAEFLMSEREKRI